MIFNKNSNGTQEVNSIATWAAGHDYRHISKALELAKRKLLFIIGKETYSLALTHYLSDDYLTENPTDEHKQLDTLVSLLQTVLVNFAYSKEIHKGTVLWDNSGIKVNWDDKYRPAQDSTLESLKESLINDGYAFLDLAIAFLHEDEVTFIKFKEFHASQLISGLFINDAEEFNFYHHINNSVSYFYDLMSILYRVQSSSIKIALSQKYYDKFIDYQAKRKELESIISFVTLFKDLELVEAAEGDIYLVDELNEYWKLTDGVWTYYAYHPVLFMNEVKVALVNYTIYYKEMENISKMKGRPDQIELLRANLNSYKSTAEASLAKITATIEELEAVPVEDVVLADEKTEYYNSTNNSFSLD